VTSIVAEKLANFSAIGCKRSMVETATAIEARYEAMRGGLNERSRRLLAAAEARALGRGGISLVSRTVGVSRGTIRRGLQDLAAMEEARANGSETSATKRIRSAGGGRKKQTEKDPTLERDLELLVDPVTRGDPESPLRWTCKSLRQLALELTKMGHQATRRTVGEILHRWKYSLQANCKTNEGASHPDRNAQFEHINAKVAEQIASQNPAISVDTKKKELVGDFKNGGREWQRKGEPEKVRTHDFVDKKLGKVNPYGVYDIANNTGWVNVGVDHDTGEFAVEGIRRWWNTMRKEAYPNAKTLLITADSGGSNGSRLRLWKFELQRLADEIGVPITVCHLPPGTSKWNKIEHRLFSFITKNWRGKPLVSRAVVVSLIAATTTKTGLKVHAELDENIYRKGRKITNRQMESIHIQRDDFHGEWNYTIVPSPKQNEPIIS